MRVSPARGAGLSGRFGAGGPRPPGLIEAGASIREMLIIDGGSGCRTCHTEEPERVQIFVKCWKHSQAASAPANAVTSERFTAR